MGLFIFVGVGKPDTVAAVVDDCEGTDVDTGESMREAVLRRGDLVIPNLEGLAACDPMTGLLSREAEVVLPRAAPAKAAIREEILDGLVGLLSGEAVLPFAPVPIFDTAAGGRGDLGLGGDAVIVD